MLDVAAGATSRVGHALERGQIVRYGRCPFPLPSDQELSWLREKCPALLARKNLSYYPDADRLKGAKGDPGAASEVKRILREHSARVRAFLAQELPGLSRGWTVGTSSFRPLEERGRDLDPHASNELVHVDAGAYGATHGGRILRFFVNLHPTQPRVWATKGTFAALHARYAERAGLTGASTSPRPWDRLRTGSLRWLSSHGVPMARVVDSSPYDRAMRRFHNFMKDDPGFRADTDGYQELSFPPLSAWMVLTDTRSHACVSGRFALVDTFVIPLENCELPEEAPFHVLTNPRPTASSQPA